MVFLKTYESYNKIKNLKKYLIWKSHEDSQILNIIEILRIDDNSSTIRPLYWYSDNTNKLVKDNDTYSQGIPIEEMTDEHIIDQSDDLEYLKMKVKIIKSTSKYNI